MNPFDTAWDLVKDFFFAPEETMQTISTRDDGSVAEFADLMGRMRPPLIEGDSYKNIRENQERREKVCPKTDLSRQGYPFVEGKHQPVIIPRTVLFDENVDPYEGQSAIIQGTFLRITARNNFEEMRDCRIFLV